MNMKHKRLERKLDRRNAIKNIDYDASNSSTSTSFDGQPTHRTRSLDIYAHTDRSSFRVDGIDGFDQICKSLGLSGPEDFSIPTAAWEARKARSPSELFPSSRFCDYYNSVKETTEDGLSNGIPAKVRTSDEYKKCENECSRLESGLNSARVRVSDGVSLEDDEAVYLNFPTNTAGGRCARDGGCGIKGVRPPVLAPPPPLSRAVVDNRRSTWDLFRDFGPRDDEDIGLPSGVGLANSFSETDQAIEENKEVDGRLVSKQDLNGERLIASIAFTESCSNSSNDDDDDDSFSMVLEPEYSVSPDRIFRPSIKSWQKGDFLGSGSFGTVYEGFTDDGFFFAVKEVSLLDQGSQGKQSISQLEQEISLLSQFKHQNIVRYLGTEKDEAKLYIFLELVNKGSLAHLYQKYHLKDSQVSGYTRQILNGLNYLHRQNVVHRDIKCANILVDVSGSVKLADFGLAKTTTFNDVKSCKGTPFWMAPEVVKGRNRGYGLMADIWSLGCTVLEMLTGQIPYSHLEGPMQAMFRIGRGEPPPIPDSLSNEAQDFILKCLQVDPDHRPTAAQLLDHPFLKKSSSASLSPASPNYYGGRQ